MLVEYEDVTDERDNDGVADTTNETDNSGDEGEAAPAKKEGGGVKPEPLQIVSIGTEEDQYAFTFHEDQLNLIISRIPPGWKVAVVSVVGAFRTGKSFLLSWFLCYLNHITTASSKETEESDKPWYMTIDSLGNDGFEWKGGSERNTTGIWMWSQPHFVSKTNPTTGEKETMAVLLVDSQGMFDNETTMSLTMSIFGLSTLLSSYQIYNVDKRIQEDNLQQLALFSEYARLAADSDTVHERSDGVKAFQRMEFLVRDWQHFEDDDEDDLDTMEREMKEYLDKVIADRDAKDLKETREQILSCFESISCFGLCHPGMKVVKKKFSGKVTEMEELFLQLLDRFCKRVFHEDHLEPKTIQGHAVTAAELGNYVKSYAGMFADGAKFPDPTTMLEATASANNTNAVQGAIDLYKTTMDRIAGPKCSNYVKPKELKDDHEKLVRQALEKFSDMATFGSKKSIESSRSRVLEKINADWEVYESLNAGRNPLAGFET